jgi:hypothetical protein
MSVYQILKLRGVEKIYGRMTTNTEELRRKAHINNLQYYSDNRVEELGKTI